MVQIAVETVSPQRIAAVTSRVHIPDIMTAWEPALLQVKSFLGDRPDLDAGGRQVFLYHHPTQRDQPMEIDFGIEVADAFEAKDNVHCVSTPEGRVATAVHLGPLTSLPQTHKTITNGAARMDTRSADILGRRMCGAMGPTRLRPWCDTRCVSSYAPSRRRKLQNSPRGLPAAWRV